MSQSTLPAAFHLHSKLATQGEPLSGHYSSSQLLPLQSSLAVEAIDVQQPLKAELNDLMEQLQCSARRGNYSAILIDSCKEEEISNKAIQDEKEAAERAFPLALQNLCSNRTNEEVAEHAGDRCSSDILFSNLKQS